MIIDPRKAYCQHVVWTISLPTDAVNFGAYLQPFPNYPRVLGENIRWFAANGVTGVYMVTMPDAVSTYARLVAASLTTDSQHKNPIDDDS